MTAFVMFQLKSGEVRSMVLRDWRRIRETIVTLAIRVKKLARILVRIDWERNRNDSLTTHKPPTKKIPQQSNF